ncbi:MAG: enoyl-CoA hydratase/isomerase family protein [Dehalococcoidia bacterium]|nr:enoyl-CoA hydratase/isomerase family protein [Dehalococcoidia bacterium]
MAAEVLQVEQNGEAVVLTLNRPEKRNALNAELRDAISATLQELENDNSVKVAIITGAGAVFCAGFDTSEFATTPPEEVFASESSRRYHWQLQHFKKPLIAAINGSAMGGGFDIAVLADIRICSEGATFGHPEIKFGAAALFGPLASVVGAGIARDLCLSGRRIDAREAQAFGLVTRVTAPGSLLDEARVIAQTVAESPLATLMQVKASIIESSPFQFPKP